MDNEQLYDEIQEIKTACDHIFDCCLLFLYDHKVYISTN